MSLETGLGGPVGKDMDERGRGTASGRVEAGEGERTESGGSRRNAWIELPASKTTVWAIHSDRGKGIGAWQCGPAVEPSAARRGAAADIGAGAQALQR